jgi:hypothetical protein
MAVGGTEAGAEPELIWLLVISALITTITIIRKQRRFV